MIRQGNLFGGHVDVRPKAEYENAHLDGAASIPLEELETRLSELPRRKEIVAYCRGPYCVLAAEAVRLLRVQGIQAYRLEGSMYDWEARGWAVVRAPGDFAALARSSAQATSPRATLIPPATAG